MGAAQLSAQATLQEPFLRTDLLCPLEGVEAIRALLGEGGAELVDEEELGWIRKLRITTEMSAASSLELGPVLRTFSPMFTFAYWQDLPGSPLVEGRHQALVLDLRRWRQLDVHIPSLSDVIQPRTQYDMDEKLGP